jgi:hypothetical protein
MHGVVMSLDQEHHQQESTEAKTGWLDGSLVLVWVACVLWNYALGTKKETDWSWMPYAWRG